MYQEVGNRTICFGIYGLHFPVFHPFGPLPSISNPLYHDDIPCMFIIILCDMLNKTVCSCKKDTAQQSRIDAIAEYDCMVRTRTDTYHVKLWPSRFDLI